MRARKLQRQDFRECRHVICINNKEGILCRTYVRAHFWDGEVEVRSSPPWTVVPSSSSAPGKQGKGISQLLEGSPVRATNQMPDLSGTGEGFPPGGFAFGSEEARLTSS